VANVNGGVVTSVTVTAPGSLYQTPPAVTFSGGGGSGASGIGVVTGGVITAVTMISGGSGYTSTPTVTIGGVRAMVSGYVQRNGSYGTSNLASTGRTTLPAWAAAAQNRSATLSSGQYGPSLTYTSGTGMNALTYTLGHYAEDYDYLGDQGYTQGSYTNAGGVFFDLNKYNARFCVTPEYPNGTWAYFVAIAANGQPSNGTPRYPYMVGRWYYGNPTAASTTTSVMNADTPLTQYYKGATSTVETWASSPVTLSSGNVVVSWNAVQGCSYTVQATSDFSTWTNLSSVTATGSSAIATETGAASDTKRFYLLNRTAVAAYDSVGY
jgi:hypothetical protein